MKRIIVKVFAVFCCTLAVISVGALLSNDNDNKEPAEEVVEIVSQKVLIPGGQSIGIKMDVKGVLVVGLEEIETEDSIVNPGLDAGIQIGDTIISINGVDVNYPSEVSEIIKNSDGVAELSILRGDKRYDYVLQAAKDYDSGEYMLGIWVKEKIAGIGTLTYYDPDSKVFAALGHGIYERKTGKLLDVASGQLLRSKVESVVEGETGSPGQIRGVFYSQMLKLGDVYKNSEYGVFAKSTISDIDLTNAIPVAQIDEIKRGKAYIYTTIEDSTVDCFEIEITKINKYNAQASKGLEIKVTDERLLESCGGIVQGMSGSPIIQNGKLVGAVTHVLVNDPTRGYGIFIENMLDAAG